MEGTRFNAEKYHSSQSGFRNLLKPKAGGIAFALNAMDGKITRLLDVTLVYHDDQYGLWDMMCGRMTSVTLVASIKDIPSELLVGDYQEDEQYRADFQAWVNQLWQDKDQLIDLMSSK